MEAQVATWWYIQPHSILRRELEYFPEFYPVSIKMGSPWL
jgi:hypothetical protein